MVCYARPASRLAAIVFVAWLVFAVPVSHFFNTAALVTAVTVAIVGAAGVAVLAFATFRSARRRRAAAGGCVSCQFRCQSAMTEPTGRFWLVTIADRRPPAPAAAGVSAESHGLAAPRWPDRPPHRAGQVSRQVPGTAPVPQRERAGSPA